MLIKSLRFDKQIFVLKHWSLSGPALYNRNIKHMTMSSF